VCVSILRPVDSKGYFGIPKATLERGDSKELELAKKQAVNYKNEKARSWQNNKYKMETVAINFEIFPQRLVFPGG
jgi:hypothetical protein